MRGVVPITGRCSHGERVARLGVKGSLTTEIDGCTRGVGRVAAVLLIVGDEHLMRAELRRAKRG
jgi:hypothetical protein